MEHSLIRSSKFFQRGLIIPPPIDSGAGAVKIIRINKATGKEYVFKIIEPEDFITDVKNGSLLGKKKFPFNCLDCGVEGLRLRLAKKRCDKCQKQVSMRLMAASRKKAERLKKREANAKTNK